MHVLKTCAKQPEWPETNEYLHNCNLISQSKQQMSSYHGAVFVVHSTWGLFGYDNCMLSHSSACCLPHRGSSGHHGKHNAINV